MMNIIITILIMLLVNKKTNLKQLFFYLINILAICLPKINVTNMQM